MSQAPSDHMTQVTINEQEWMNPENWHCTFYYSAKDNRTFVPRRWFGVTVNFASAGTYWFLGGLFVVPTILTAAAVLALALTR